MLAWLEYETSVCGGCGGYLPETMNPDNEGRYKAGPPGRCFRCSAVHAHQKGYEDQNPASLRVWPVELKRREARG